MMPFEDKVNLALRRRRALRWTAVFLSVCLLYWAVSCAEEHRKYKQLETFGERSLLCEKTSELGVVRVYLWRVMRMMSEIGIIGIPTRQWVGVLEIQDDQRVHHHFFGDGASDSSLVMANFPGAKNTAPPDSPNMKWYTQECEKLQIKGRSFYFNELGLSWNGGVSFEIDSDTLAGEGYRNRLVPLDKAPRFLAKGSVSHHLDGQFRTLPVKGFKSLFPASKVDLLDDSTVRVTRELILPIEVETTGEVPQLTTYGDYIQWREDASLRAVYELRRDNAQWKLLSLEQIGSLETPANVELILPPEVPFKPLKQ
jgi:hypothetical protein